MPLLSICIPTYNRSEILENSLASIVSQDIFSQSDDIEIIISDNCSTDNTKEVVKKYISSYGQKIKYFCNEENVEDANFALALSRGQGEFLKICNDTLIFEPNALENMLNLVKANKKNKSVLFFLNNNKQEDIYCSGLDDFIKIVSFYSTWLGGFGMWKEDRKSYLPLLEQYSTTKLPQTVTLLKMISDKKDAVVCQQQFSHVYRPSLSGEYNLSEIFIKNYLAFYKPYLKSGEISSKTYEKEKWLVLKKHVLPRQFNVKYKFEYDKSEFWKYTQIYHKNSKFYILILKCWIKKLIKMKIFKTYFHKKA